MKEFIKKYSLVLAIAAAVIFLTVFMLILFRKTGDSVYVVDMNGSVTLRSSDDLSSSKSVAPGEKLSVNDIVLTGNKSSCVLAYKKKAGAKDDFINIGENSQVTVYSKNAQGGYNFFVSDGSVICNMTESRSYKTIVSSSLFNLYADNTITKIAYDAEEGSGKVFTFDGNPMLQVRQPSGTVSETDKLMKNSVCALQKMDDGTVGFGMLNTAFGLNSLTAQDLKVMSGIAGTWSEKISYGMNEFEQAFQTASDYAKWAATEPVLITTVSETEMTMPVTETAVYTETSALASDVTEPGTTSYTVPTGATQTVPSQYNTGTSAGDSRAADNARAPFTAFTRQTIVDLESGETYTVTTVPADKDDRDSSGTKKTQRTTASARNGTTAGTQATEKSETAGTTVTSGGSSGGSKTTSAGKTYGTSSSSKPVVTSVPSSVSVPTVTTVPPGEEVRKSYYTVIFSYNINGEEYWSVQLVRYGQSAIAATAISSVL